MTQKNTHYISILATMSSAILGVVLSSSIFIATLITQEFNWFTSISDTDTMWILTWFSLGFFVLVFVSLSLTDYIIEKMSLLSRLVQSRKLMVTTVLLACGLAALAGLYFYLTWFFAQMSIYYWN